MTTNKLITVYGATGSQGRSVVKSLLQNTSEQFSVRGITRNPESSSAKSLAALGAEMVKADSLNKEELTEAFRDSWGAFINTMGSSDKDGPRERDIGKTIIDAAAEAGVKYVIYSGLVSAAEITNGAFPSRDFDEKAIVSEYAKSKGFRGTIIAAAGNYYESFLSGEIITPELGGWPLHKDEEGFFTWRIPFWGGDGKIPLIAMESDFGDIVHGMFLNPDAYNGQFIQVFSDNLTADEMVATFQKVTGKKSRYLPIDDWRTINSRGDSTMEDTKTMFGFCYESGGKYYGGPNDLTMSRKLKALAAAAKGQDDQAKTLTTFEAHLRNQPAI